MFPLDGVAPVPSPSGQMALLCMHVEYISSVQLSGGNFKLHTSESGPRGLPG
jgi:hypothetical protein